MKEYDAIFIGGNTFLEGGRVIAGFRLRTELQKYGYDLMVIDSAVTMVSRELLDLLDAVITNRTLVIGFSTIWLDGFSNNHVPWAEDAFFKILKAKYPKIKLVAGGPESHWSQKSIIIYQNCEWAFEGYSDQSFPKFLDYLHKKPNHGFKFIVKNNKKVVDSNMLFPIKVPDDNNTVFEKCDKFLPYQPLPIELSRGCVFTCSFCHIPYKGMKDPDSYIRTPQNIAEELRRNYELFGTTRYAILDDTFNDSMEKLDRLHRAIDLAKLPKFEFVSYIRPELLVTKPQMIPKLIELGIGGGYIGMESLKHESRKSIRKGMDANRILDSVADFRSKSNVKLHASFIVGLPYQSATEVIKTHEFLVDNKSKLFNSWRFQTMTIFYNQDLEGGSEIDKDPAKYGYTIIDKAPDRYAIWTNEYMTQPIARNITEDLNKLAAKESSPAGWLLATAWHLGISQSDIDSMSDDDLILLQKGAHENRKRAIELLTSYGIPIRQYFQ